MTPAQPQKAQPGEPRRAVVIVAVLVVVVILALAGYQYSDSMLSEYKASEYTHRSLQAKAFADSGVLYAAAMLSSPNNFNNTLSANPWNNPQYFQGQIVPDENGQPVGYFSIIAPPDPLTGTPTDVMYGVIDEGGKINLNSMMKIDPTGQLLGQMLMNLPNMTEQIAYSIVSWLGGSFGQTNGGAQNDFYTGLTPPYQCRNGPIDSIDELLLVQGVTRDLLYGSDVNRNGAQDPNEAFSPGGLTSNNFDRGWSAFLTVHSREQNYDPNGNAFIYLNNTDLSQLQAALALSGLSQSMQNFIIMYRIYGPANSTGSSQGGGNNTASTMTADPSTWDSSKLTQPKQTIQSIFQLVSASVSIQSTDPVTKKSITTKYASPLNDPNTLSVQLPNLFSVATLVDPSQNTEMPARININTAPAEVLACIPTLQETEIQQILAVRPSLSTPQGASDMFQTPTWLLTEAQLSLSTLKAQVYNNPSGGQVTLDNLLTTRTQVFRVQSVGYFGGKDKGPAIRVEAIVDTNSGRPRILAWRNLTELGKGWNGMPP